MTLPVVRMSWYGSLGYVDHWGLVVGTSLGTERSVGDGSIPGSDVGSTGCYILSY